MRFVFRSVPVIALVLGLGAARVEAQQVVNPNNDNNRWWIGGGGGVTIYSSQLREHRGIPTAGGSLMIKSKRTGLLIGFEEAFNRGAADTTAMAVRDSTGTYSNYAVTYHDVRKLYAALMAFPFHSAAQPYFGVGFGVLQVVNPQVQLPVALPGSTIDSVGVRLQDARSWGFLTFIGGVNFNAGPLTAYGQYQFTSSPNDGQLLRGPTHTVTAGLRINLGRSRESISGGGY
jgi:hypothetical protein